MCLVEFNEMSRTLLPQERFGLIWTLSAVSECHICEKRPACFVEVLCRIIFFRVWVEIDFSEIGVALEHGHSIVFHFDPVHVTWCCFVSGVTMAAPGTAAKLREFETCDFHCRRSCTMSTQVQEPHTQNSYLSTRKNALVRSVNGAWERQPGSPKFLCLNVSDCWVKVKRRFSSRDCQRQPVHSTVCRQRTKSRRFLSCVVLCWPSDIQPPSDTVHKDALLLRETSQQALTTIVESNSLNFAHSAPGHWC